MPGRGSWDGRWSGESDCYAIVKTIANGRKHVEKAERLVTGSPYTYRWSDGWAASVSVRIAEGADIRKTRKASRGFCGYDWMVRSIYEHGAIYDRTEEP